MDLLFRTDPVSVAPYPWKDQRTEKGLGAKSLRAYLNHAKAREKLPASDKVFAARFAFLTGIRFHTGN
jgi:hypothetical protein